MTSVMKDGLTDKRTNQTLGQGRKNHQTYNQTGWQSLFELGFDTEAISRWTGALSVCGGCGRDIAQFLKDISEQQKRD